MFTHIDEEIEKDGFTLSARVEHYAYMGEPWKEHDGHGPVSDRTCRDKLPGELVLSDDGRQKRFYDFAEACRIARRDGWGSPPFDIAGETPRQKAARAALADYHYLRRWCDGQWSWCGVVVTASKAGVKLGTASCWGIEDEAGDYLVEVANEMIDEALDDARSVVASINT